MRFQAFFFASKKVKGFSSDVNVNINVDINEDINVAVISAVSSEKTCLSFLKF